MKSGDGGRLLWPAAALLLALLLLLSAGAAAAGEELLAPPEPRTSEEQATRDALRAALLGDRARLARLAAVRAAEEDDLRRAGLAPEPLSGNIAALAAAVSDPPPTRAEARAALRPHPRDFETRQFLEALRRSDPRERFLDARASRIYEDRRRVVNSFTNAAFGVLSLQFFSLLQPPLDLVEHLTVNRKVLNPEQRRELHFARQLEASGLQSTRPRGEERALGWVERRRALAELQARRNARRALREGEPSEADWWFRREMLLAGEAEPFRRDHRELVREQAEAAERAVLALSVRPGEERIPEAQRPAYDRLVRALVLDPGGGATGAAARELLALDSRGPAAPEARVALAAQALRMGEPEWAIEDLKDARRYAGRDSAWAARADGHLRTIDFNPSRAIREGLDAKIRRRHRFLLYAEDPRIFERSLTPDEARRQDSRWIEQLRAVFVFDLVGRVIALPFLPPRTFPAPEFFAAVENQPEWHRDTREGQRWIRRAARDLERRRRYDEAIRLHAEAGEVAKEERARRRLVRSLEATARRSASPAVRIASYERILEESADPRRLERAERQLAFARLSAEARAQLSRREAIAFDDAVGLGRIGLATVLLDGNPDNGEISPEGIWLLDGDEVAYFDLGRQEIVRVQGPEGASARAAQILTPLRRWDATRERLREPSERKRIPLAIEGGFGPGFDAMPGLVPLDIDPRARRLYD